MTPAVICGCHRARTSRSRSSRTTALRACPYDLRHAGVSLWLNAGVHAPEVAERAGHCVDVLPKVCVECIDGDLGDMKVMNATGLTRRWPDQVPGVR
jgi:hypothetical protein